MHVWFASRWLARLYLGRNSNLHVSANYVVHRTYYLGITINVASDTSINKTC